MSRWPLAAVHFACDAGTLTLHAPPSLRESRQSLSQSTHRAILCLAFHTSVQSCCHFWLVCWMSCFLSERLSSLMLSRLTFTALGLLPSPRTDGRLMNLWIPRSHSIGSPHKLRIQAADYSRTQENQKQIVRLKTWLWRLIHLGYGVGRGWGLTCTSPRFRSQASMQQQRWVRTDEAQRPRGLLSSFLFTSNLIRLTPKKTMNDPTDRGIFHNSNRHCLGFITSSAVHPSAQAAVISTAGSPVRLVSSQLPLVKSLGSGTHGGPQTHCTSTPAATRHMRPVSGLGCP